MSASKTRPTGADVGAFIDAVAPPRRRQDARQLDEIMQRVTGWRPQMWGPSIIGYGSYHYVYDSGRQGDMCALGFSPRKANMVLYVLTGYDSADDILARLGKFRVGSACLYFNKLDDLDPTALDELLHHGLSQLRARWPVAPS